MTWIDAAHLTSNSARPSGTQPRSRVTAPRGKGGGRVSYSALFSSPPVYPQIGQSTNTKPNNAIIRPCPLLRPRPVLECEIDFHFRLHRTRDTQTGTRKHSHRTRFRPGTSSWRGGAAAAVAFPFPHDPPFPSLPFLPFIPPSRGRRYGGHLTSGHVRSGQVRSPRRVGGRLGGWDLHHAGELELGVLISSFIDLLRLSPRSATGTWVYGTMCGSWWKGCH